LLAFAVLGAGCKGGLFTDQGNNFPCDFSQPEGARDTVCAPGDVCGVDNLCKKYRYEGPQFDTGASAPVFGSALVKHPGPLDRPVAAVTRGLSPPNPPFNRVAVIAVLGSSTDGVVVPLDVDQLIAMPHPPVPFPGDVRQLTAVAITSSAQP